MTPLETALIDLLSAQGMAVLVRAADGAVLYANRAAQAMGWHRQTVIMAEGLATQPLSDGKTLITRPSARLAAPLVSAREEMVHRVAHDLLTPIGVIDGFSELLTMTGELDEEQQSFLEKIRAGSGRLTRMARLITRYAWIAADLPIGEQAVAVRGVFDDLLHMLTSRARDRRIVLDVQADDDLPPVRADGPMLQAALEQVALNSLVYSEPGAKITLRAARRGDWIDFTVQDNGPGIPADELPYIFDPSFRGGDTRVQEVAGAGYGLSLVSGAVERMGGEVAIASQAGAGTTVVLSLPVAQG